MGNNFIFYENKAFNKTKVNRRYAKIKKCRSRGK